MKWYVYIICFVLILVGVFCSIELVNVFNIKSAEYGTAITIETVNDYSEVSMFDLGSLVLDTEDYVTYSSVLNFAPEKFNGKENTYTILFDGKPVTNIVTSAGKISGDFVMCFENLDGETICTAELHILIEYYASGTKVSLVMTNNNNSVSYLSQYTNINGAVIKVVQKEVK